MDRIRSAHAEKALPAQGLQQDHLLPLLRLDDTEHRASPVEPMHLPFALKQGCQQFSYWPSSPPSVIDLSGVPHRLRSKYLRFLFTVRCCQLLPRVLSALVAALSPADRTGVPSLSR